MRVRDLANAANVPTDAVLEEIKKLGMPNSPAHANSTIPEEILKKLTETYPQIASLNQGDSPEPASGDAAPQAGASDAAPAESPVAPAAPQDFAPAAPSAPTAPAAPTPPQAPVAPTVPPAPVAPPAAPAAPTPPAPPRTSPLNVVPQSDAPKDNTDPASRAAVARDAVARQFEKVPEAAVRKYRVSYPGADPAIIEATNENEAWAKYNDRNQKSWSPRLREVQEWTLEMQAAAQKAAAAAGAVPAGA